MAGSDLPKHVRAVFLSDLHLGYRISRGASCLDLLQNIRADKIFLVGDIVDESRLKAVWYWPADHQAIVDSVASLIDSGAEVFFTPGNHDAGFRGVEPLSNLDDGALKKLLLPFLGAVVGNELSYSTLAGKKLLVAHGDLFDRPNSRLGVVRSWGAKVFDRWNWLLPRAAILNVRAFFKFFLARPDRIRQKLFEYAKDKGFDGVVFGHLHAPCLEKRDELLFANCGDWVINESFLVETLEGEFRLYNFGSLIEQIQNC